MIRQVFGNVDNKPEKFACTPEDMSGWSHAEKLGQPGLYPFTRGIYPDMYRERPWTMRQYAGYGCAEEANQRFRYLLANGQTGLSVAFDLPTQMGYDSDDPMAAGEVGRTGVAIDTVADMEFMFEGIDLSTVSTSMTINATSAILLAMYRQVGLKQGVPPNMLHGTVQNDILKEYEARNTYIFPPSASMRLTIDIFEYCARNMPHWNTISMSGYHIREAGASAVQELAFTFSNAIQYINEALKRGLDIDQIGPQLSFFFVAQMNLFEEIAKFRAARRIWAHIMRDKFKARNARSMMLRFHVQTAGSSLTLQQPDNNVVRTTIEALSAVLGGAQSLHTNSKDEALGLPSAGSALTALRTQQIIASETGILNVVDPCGGSYYLERLTDQIEDQVHSYLTEIEKLGGAVAAIEAGYIQREIQDSAYKHHRAVEAGQRIIVGINKFQDEESKLLAALKVDPQIETKQRLSLAKLKAKRDKSKVDRTLDILKKVAQGTENLMPPIIDAVDAMVTVGEISSTLKVAFGKFNPPVTI